MEGFTSEKKDNKLIGIRLERKTIAELKALAKDNRRNINDQFEVIFRQWKKMKPLLDFAESGAAWKAGRKEDSAKTLRQFLMAMNLEGQPPEQKPRVSGEEP